MDPNLESQPTSRISNRLICEPIFGSCDWGRTGDPLLGKTRKIISRKAEKIYFAEIPNPIHCKQPHYRGTRRLPDPLPRRWLKETQHQFACRNPDRNRPKRLCCPLSDGPAPRGHVWPAETLRNQRTG